MYYYIYKPSKWHCWAAAEISPSYGYIDSGSVVVDNINKYHFQRFSYLARKREAAIQSEDAPVPIMIIIFATCLYLAAAVAPFSSSSASFNMIIIIITLWLWYHHLVSSLDIFYDENQLQCRRILIDFYWENVPKIEIFRSIVYSSQSHHILEPIIIRLKTKTWHSCMESHVWYPLFTFQNEHVLSK